MFYTAGARRNGAPPGFFERLKIFTCFFSPRTPCGVRRAYCVACKRNAHFNPRTPCGVRREESQAVTIELRISIHALRVECDDMDEEEESEEEISIHALRVECDLLKARSQAEFM